jgi:hypothetical protein
MVRERLYEIDQNDVYCPSTYYFTNGSATCTNGNPSLPPGTWSSCGPKGTTVISGYIFERGKMNDCLVNAAVHTARKPLVYTASWTSACNHSPNGTGPTLGEDCNCVTLAVCRKAGNRPDGLPWSKCCEMDETGHQVPLQDSVTSAFRGRSLATYVGRGWNQYCAAQASSGSSSVFDLVCGLEISTSVNVAVAP